MCGIFGLIATSSFNTKLFKKLAKESERRGKDSSGLVLLKKNGSAQVIKADFAITKLCQRVQFDGVIAAIGHSRLITNGITDNQPISRGDYIGIHNGIILDREETWDNLQKSPKLEIDSELILAVMEDYEFGLTTPEKFTGILDRLAGVINTCVLAKNHSEAILYSNNGSLWRSDHNNDTLFASEKVFLKNILGDHAKVTNVTNAQKIAIPRITNFKIQNIQNRARHPLIFELTPNIEAEKLLEFERPVLRRCSKCILPSTMPFISFDNKGVCNYCNNYKPLKLNSNLENLKLLVERYKKNSSDADCIVPFSGGRDSCYTLHLAVKDLGLRPITYTYDWGMVTDLGRRNISRMCSELGVENIIFAADIERKRNNIRKNVLAWLKRPHLGMVNIFTAGDKHFFRFVDTVKRETGLKLNLWGINPLETTHFKTGFLGMPPAFADTNVYSSGWSKQVEYHKLRWREFARNPSYINNSLYDTYSGEFFRSLNNKRDYAHVYDFIRWDEQKVNMTLINDYGWETARDTSTTWRIGDATAPFYNYIFYFAAGFTEHDTFRSNQIREGDITREHALNLVERENEPRYENLKWYLDCLNLDYTSVISKIKSMKKLY